VTSTVRDANPFAASFSKKNSEQPDSDSGIFRQSWVAAAGH
jgi:hypothetical protein